MQAPLFEKGRRPRRDLEDVIKKGTDGGEPRSPPRFRVSGGDKC